MLGAVEPAAGAREAWSECERESVWPLVRGCCCWWWWCWDCASDECGDDKVADHFGSSETARRRRWEAVAMESF
jgi:hypothetical protein